MMGRILYFPSLVADKMYLLIIGHYTMYLPLCYHVDVLILQARQPKHESSLRRVFCRHASKIKNVQNSGGKSSTHHKSLCFVTSCGLIAERKYIRCTALVELYTSHQMHIRVVYFYSLILIWVLLFVMFVFMWIQLGPQLGVSIRRLLGVRRLHLLTHHVGALERRVTVKCSQYNE